MERLRKESLRSVGFLRIFSGGSLPLSYLDALVARRYHLKMNGIHRGRYGTQ